MFIKSRRRISGLSAGKVKSVLTTFIRSFQCRSRIASIVGEWMMKVELVALIRLDQSIRGRSIDKGR